MVKRLLVVGLVSGLAAVPVASAGRNSARQASIQTLDAGVLVQLNAIRATHGLVSLKVNPRLAAAAERHSAEMLADGYFAHNSHNGAPFWKRLASYAVVGHAWSVGENLLWSSPEVDASAALRMWMASPEHRRNILDPSWREIGVAAVHANTAPGTYGGRPVTIITTDFGARH